MSGSSITDLNTAKEYYNGKSEGLGKKMASEVDAVLNLIALNPFTFSTRYKDVRAANLHTFPYLIFYKIDTVKHSIFIIRVFNTYRKPFW
jgi:hypothetical protein